MASITQIFYSIFRSNDYHVNVDIPRCIVGEYNTREVGTVTKGCNCDQIDPIRQFDFPLLNVADAYTRYERQFSLFRNNESINIQGGSGAWHRESIQFITISHVDPGYARCHARKCVDGDISRVYRATCTCI